jgi:hypothetical protein
VFEITPSLRFFFVVFLGFAFFSPYGQAFGVRQKRIGFGQILDQQGHWALPGAPWKRRRRAMGRPNAAKIQTRPKCMSDVTGNPCQLQGWMTLQAV